MGRARGWSGTGAGRTPGSRSGCGWEVKAGEREMVVPGLAPGEQNPEPPWALPKGTCQEGSPVQPLLIEGQHPLRGKGTFPQCLHR